MKRLVLSPHDPAEFLGGTERVVQAMVAARLRRGEEIALFCGTERFEGDGLTEQRAEPGLSVIRIVRGARETGEIFLRPRVRRELERVIDAVNPDIVEWHHGATLSLDLVQAAAARGAKVIMFLHDLWTSCPRFFRMAPGGLACPTGGDRDACVPCVNLDLPWERSRLVGWVQAFAECAREELRAASLRIAPSQSHARALESYFPDVALDLKAVPHGLLDTEISVPPARPEAQEAGLLRIAHFGNLVPEKGLEDLANGLAQLAQPARVAVELWGAELAPGFVSKLQAVCPMVRWKWHGPYSSYRAICADVAQCDIAAFPSRAPESYGLVVDEAMAARLPVLVSNRGAMPERIGKAGVVLPAERASPWREIVQSLLDHPARLAALRAAVQPAARTIENAIDEIDEYAAQLG